MRIPRRDLIARIPRRGLIAALALAVIVVGGGIVAASADAATIPLGQTIKGKATYYDDAGYGACGKRINAGSDMLVAVSRTYWTTANPNNDPLCTGISVQATYHGKTVTVPVRDKCPSCGANHIDLSKAAFAQLVDPDVGVVKGITWKFVKTRGHTPASSAPAPGPTGSAGSSSAGSGAEHSSSAGSGTGGPGSSGSGSAHSSSAHSSSASSGTAGSGRASSGMAGSGTGTTISVLLTGYGWWDNTPAGSSEISNPVLHQAAGGTGTYADPITVAVPYHCTNGCLQWPAGTRFYLPSLQRYLIVEDTCGDAGPDSCPDSTNNHLDVWVGGKSLSHSASDACEERITGTTSAILQPASGLPVTAGDICR